MNHLLILCGLFGGLGTGEILIIAVIILLLFGGNKIPEMMKGMGKGVRSFKEGLHDVQAELKRDVTATDEVKKEEAKQEDSQKEEVKK